MEFQWEEQRQKEIFKLLRVEKKGFRENGPYLLVSGGYKEIYCNRRRKISEKV